MSEDQVFIGFSGRHLLEILQVMYPPDRIEAIRQRAIQNAIAEGREWIAHRSILLAAYQVVDEQL